MFSKAKTAIIAVFCLFALAALTGCGSGKDAANKAQGLSGSITVVGSTAIQPLAEQAAADFMANNPYVRITV